MWRCSARTADGRFYNPLSSPQGDKLVAHSQVGHLHIIELATGAKIDLGEGYAAHWSPDGKQIVCNLSMDDGRQITSSEIITIDIETQPRTQITDAEHRVEMYPTWAPDGTRIAYEDAKSGETFVHDVPRGDD